MKNELHTHLGSKVTMSSGEVFLHVFTREALVSKVIEIKQSGGIAMNTSKYGYRGKNKHLEALEDVTLFIDKMESIVPFELFIEVSKPEQEK